MLHDNMTPALKPYPALKHSNPGSQESLASCASGTPTSTLRSMAASSDTHSQATADTALTSPTSPRTTAPNETPVIASNPAHAPYDRADSAHAAQRLRTPENPTTDASANGQPTASPLAVVTPIVGHKRLASGELKYSPSQDIPGAASHQFRRASHSSSAASEAACNLKERLAYAMAKVQHGWERHNIDQVEQLAAATLTPRSAMTPRSAQSKTYLTSPRATGLPARALVDQFAEHSGPHNMHTLRRPSSSEASMSPPRKPLQALGPPAGLTSPREVHRRSGSFSRPMRPSVGPTTPKSDRHTPTVRTQMQTAHDEQEAMDALLLMGSPSNGNFPRGSQRSSATESPRRSQQVNGGSFPAPRMALQYRSESGDSFTSSASSGFGYHHGHSAAEMMRQRADVLDQIEAET